jgi:hypothetical protein
LKSIFVHLGVEKAEHLWLNIKHLNDLFPKLSVVVILDDERHLPELKNLKVETFIFSRIEYMGNQLGELNHDMEFRNGFWRHSIERFIALAAWHQAFPLETFVHFESDILVMPDFPWEKMCELKTLAWLRFNHEKDVAAIVFSPNPEATLWLSDLICNELAKNPDLTDMTALSLISRGNPKRVTILPTLMTGDIPSHGVKDVEVHYELDGAVEFFGGIFDGAAIGMWLTGQDPRNNLGWIKRYVSLFESDVDPSLLKLEIGNGGLLTAEYKGRIISLFNLHIHSKQLSFFGNNWRSKLKSDIISSRHQRNSRRLSVKVVSSIFQTYLAKNQLLSRNSLMVLKNFLKTFRKMRD